MTSLDQRKQMAEERLAALVERFDGRVRRSVAGRVSDSSAREDVVQETWARVMRHLPSLLAPEKTEAWVLSIARSCAVDHHRRRRTGPLPEEPAAARLSRSGWIWEEVDRLSVEYAEVLRLRYAAGADYDEISRTLGVPVTTVRGRLFQARHALRELIERRKSRP